MKKKQKSKRWFEVVKKIILIRYKKPKFVYLGTPPENGAIIVSNHEGTDAPLSLELFTDLPLAFWGAYEMNNGVKQTYKYQSEIYYHQKKHWNIVLAKAFCLLASPLTTMFYKGLHVISVYRDARFRRTLDESIRALTCGDNVVIFPEDSKNGYLPQLEAFFDGFLVLAELCEKKGVKVPIYITFFKRKELVYIFDAPVYYSDLKSQGLTRSQISKLLLERCNELGRMQIGSEKK
jgi:1-acyl-sn-glycerol-3-phosphate acyltransferase